MIQPLDFVSYVINPGAGEALLLSNGSVTCYPVSLSFLIVLCLISNFKLGVLLRRVFVCYVEPISLT